jgi:hypothetical protein
MDARLQEMDRLLNNESKEYKQVEEVTTYLRQTLDPFYRNIFDVIRQLKVLIPKQIFSEYELHFRNLIDGCFYTAPEAFCDRWTDLAGILMMIKDTHPNAELEEKLRQALNK